MIFDIYEMQILMTYVLFYVLPGLKRIYIYFKAGMPDLISPLQNLNKSFD